MIRVRTKCDGIIADNHNIILFQGVKEPEEGEPPPPLPLWALPRKAHEGNEGKPMSFTAVHQKGQQKEWKASTEKVKTSKRSENRETKVSVSALTP